MMIISPIKQRTLLGLQEWLMYEAKIHIPVERQPDSLSRPAHMDVDGLEKQLFNMILATRNLQCVSIVGKFKA